MKRLLIVSLLIALALSVGFGCGKKETERPADKVPPEVKKAEVMDTTRMDSAMMESTMVDTTAVDTLEEPEETM
jgi:hypothetical protein